MTHMQTITGQRNPGTIRPEDIQHHQAMVKLVFEWMVRTHGSQQLLVRCLEEFWQRRGQTDYRCDHSLLSRILNPVEPHVPTPNRPRSMQILQAAMVVCSRAGDPNVIAEPGDDDAVWSSDDEQAFKIHRVRLRQLRENSRGSLFESLHRIGEFFAAARGMDDRAPSNELGETLRQRASENVLLALAAIIDPGREVTRLANRLKAEGVAAAEATRLEAEQVARAERVLAAAAQPTVNMKAYAGPILFHCGERQRGMNLLLEAVAASHDFDQRHDPHWRTLLDLLERLLVCGDAEGVVWSARARALAEAAPSRGGGYARLLREAWHDVSVPTLREAWRKNAAALVAKLDELPTAASPAPPVQPMRRVKARAITPVLAVALGLFAFAGLTTSGTTLFAATSNPSLSSTPSDHFASIHGREANRPAPQPPPPTDPNPPQA